MRQEFLQGQVVVPVRHVRREKLGQHVLDSELQDGTRVLVTPDFSTNTAEMKRFIRMIQQLLDRCGERLQGQGRGGVEVPNEDEEHQDTEGRRTHCPDDWTSLQCDSRFSLPTTVFCSATCDSQRAATSEAHERL